MTAPIPITVSDHGPRTRFRWSPLASVWAATSGFLTSSRLMAVPRSRLSEPLLGRLPQGLERGVLKGLPPPLGRPAAGLALLHVNLRLRGPGDCKEPAADGEGT